MPGIIRADGPPSSFGDYEAVDAVSDDFNGSADDPPEDAKWFRLEPTVYFSANQTAGVPYSDEFLQLLIDRDCGDVKSHGDPNLFDRWIWNVDLAKLDGSGRLKLGAKSRAAGAPRPSGVPEAPSGSEYLFESGQITSRAHVKHGYFELKGKLLDGAAVSAFWLYKNNVETQYPDQWNPILPNLKLSTTEIDIFENHGSLGGGTYGAAFGYKNENDINMVGFDDNPTSVTFESGKSVFQTVHVGDSDDGSTDVVPQRLFNCPVNYLTQDVVDGLSWDEDVATWYINGTATQTIPLDGTGSLQTLLDSFASPQYQDNTLRFPMQVKASVEMHTFWMATVAGVSSLSWPLDGISAIPKWFEIDHIRVWQRKGQGPELIGDGAFASGVGGWTEAVVGNGEATFAVEEGRAKLNIVHSGSNESGVKLERVVTGLEAGKDYILNYHGWSSRGRDMVARLVSTDGNTVYWSSKEFLPRDPRILRTDAPSVYAQGISSQSFINLKVHPSGAFPGGAAKLEFLFGGPTHVVNSYWSVADQDGIVLLDNISLKSVDAGTAPPASDHIVNGDFSKGGANWSSSVHEGASFSSGPTVSNGSLSAAAAPASPPQAWHAQIIQDDIVLPAAGEYVLQFKAARVAGADRALGIDISGSPGGPYYAGGTVTVTAASLSDQEAVLTFPFSVSTGPAAVKLAFFMGDVSGELQLDDVSLTGPGAPGGGGPPPAGNFGSVIVNGGFADGSGGTAAGWITEIQAGDGVFSPLTESMVLSGSNFGTENWHVKLIQSDLPVNEAGTWTLQFNAKTDAAAKTIFVDLAADEQNPIWYAGQSVGLTGSLTPYSMSVVVNQAQISDNGILRFNLGGSSGGVTIDDVELLPPGSTGGTSGDLVANGDFAAGSGTPWTFSAVPGEAAGSLSVVNGEGVVSQGSTGSADWHAQLFQEGISLAANHTYTVKFKARSASERVVKVLMSQDGGQWLGTSGELPLNSTMQEKSYIFTSGASATTNGQLSILLGTGPGQQDVIFDDIRIEE